VKRRGGDIEQIGAVDFYEQSHFFIETLKDDLCQKDEGGWYSLKEPVEKSEILEPSSSLLIGDQTDSNLCSKNDTSIEVAEKQPFTITQEKGRDADNPLK